MLFHTLEFGVFLVLVLLGATALRRRTDASNAFLLIASAVFFGAWDARFLLLIGASTLLDWLVGRELDRRTTAAPDAAYVRRPAARRRLLALSIAGNLLSLGCFKYAGFFASSAAEMLTALGVDVAPPVLHIVLPVGISFYTFQSMSYSLDIYRGHLRAEPSLARFALFVAFFPQLVAGPIVRARELLPQIARPRRVGRDDLSDAAWWIGWGLFKKVYVADNLARLVEPVFDGRPANSGVALVGVYAFALQIYCDFSAYTDIARGVALALGFRLPPNFDVPYAATDPRDFWRRWHISLSTWLRDYLYLPLGGNRRGRLFTLRNLFLTMLLGGLWHGAAWTFVLWGAFHGVWLAIHRAVAGRVPRAPRWVARVVTFHLVCLGWVLFRAGDMATAGDVLAALARPGLTGARFDSLAAYALPIVVWDVARFRTGDEFVVRRLRWPARVGVYVLLWFLATLLGRFGADEFLYFQF